MIKRFLFFVIIAAVISGIIFSGCSDNTTTTTEPSSAETTPVSTPTEAQEEPIELEWLLTNTGINEMNFDWKAVMGGEMGWAARVTEATNGRVTFNYLIGSVTAPGMYDSLVSGTGDIATNVVLINTGRFPVTELMTVPDFFSVCQRPSMVTTELWKNTPEIQAEFSEAKLLDLHCTVPSPPGIGFATVDEPITTLEQTKGMKMGIYGKWGTKMTEALGFTAVAVPNPEVYEAIQRGVVDGSFMSSNFLTIQNVGELVNYWHPISMMYCPFWLSINWDTWNALPPDVQKIMEDLAVDIPDNVDNACREELAHVLAQWPDLEIVEIAPEEQARWIECQKPVQAEYIAELEAKGIDGQVIFDEMERLLDVYSEAAE